MSKKIIRFSAHHHAVSGVDDTCREKQRPLGSLMQLPLSLDIEHCVLVFALDDMDGREFLRQVKELQPRFIADLRHFRHFNLSGVGALAARNTLNASGAKYISEEISFSDFEKSSVKYDVIRNHCENIIGPFKKKSSQLKGPLFVLVHHGRHARLVSEYMREIFSPSNKWWTSAVDQADYVL